MGIGISILLISVLIIAIWVVIEMKRMRHKIFAVFLIGLILFSYFSFSLVLKNQEIDFMTIEGITTATTLYFSWIGTVFSNFRTITSKAIKMDWEGNETG